MNYKYGFPQTKTKYASLWKLLSENISSITDENRKQGEFLEILNYKYSFPQMKTKEVFLKKRCVFTTKLKQKKNEKGFSKPIRIWNNYKGFKVP